MHPLAAVNRMLLIAVQRPPRVLLWRFATPMMKLRPVGLPQWVKRFSSMIVSPAGWILKSSTLLGCSQSSENTRSNMVNY
jgi:hypothetical protein